MMTDLLESNVKLTWSPIGPDILLNGNREGGMRLLVAPFVQRATLKPLLDGLGSHEDLKIITRWNAGDLASGVSDPLVYEECKGRGIPLYVHSSIHLKIMTMGSGRCFCGSANITNAGLGYGDRNNIEAGVWLNLALADWGQLYEIVHRSRLVDDDVFAAAVKYREEQLHRIPSLPRLILPEPELTELTLATLPATLTPDAVADYVVSSFPNENPTDFNCAIHDLVTYGGSVDTERAELIQSLGRGFLGQTFVKDIIEHIRKSGSLRFGEMSQWIHQHCREVPIPYRWEIKQATHILYNWLAFYVPEISWSVPGKRSQVIRWKAK